MRVIHTPDLELTRNCVLVPTMGALHGGHASLIQAAARRARIEGVPSAVSIFVNPKQFNDPKDFDTYPDRMDDDLAMCEQAGVDIVFHPSVETVYPPGEDVTRNVIIPDVASKPGLEDTYRPGHFDGVCKVVSRLFDLCDPSAAVFGEKDWEQIAKEGGKVFHINQIERDGIPAVFDQIYEILADVELVYVSFDIDTFDMSYAPGTGSSSPTGVTPNDLFPELRKFAATKTIVGFDIVEYNPFYDNRGQQTARLARRIMLQFLTGIAMRKDGIDPDYVNPAITR